LLGLILDLGVPQGNARPEGRAPDHVRGNGCRDQEKEDRGDRPRDRRGIGEIDGHCREDQARAQRARLGGGMHPDQHVGQPQHTKPRHETEEAAQQDQRSP
jgi:hypothetical protein